MEITIRNKNLQRVEVIDIVNSFIWTDRYSRAGDFEISTKATPQYVLSLQEDYYLTIKESEHAMIIETLNLTTDIETGNTFKVTGRSLESILERRIVWKQTILSGSLQNGIKRLLIENAISPEDPDRKISNLVFEESLDPAITDLSIDSQYLGDDLYSVIENLCSSNNIGFKITISPENLFVFKLYSGEDRSYAQSENPVVSFSPKLDNISNTTYYHSKAPHKTITLVAGEGDGTDRSMVQVGIPNFDNRELNRREKFTDASDISANVEGGTLDETQYDTLLVQKGLISLFESQQVSSFDGEVIPTVNYTYGTDFFIGDIVQMENEYGLSGRSRVTELIVSEDLSGRNIFPTFETIQ